MEEPMCTSYFKKQNQEYKNKESAKGHAVGLFKAAPVNLIPPTLTTYELIQPHAECICGAGIHNMSAKPVSLHHHLG